MTRDEFIGEMDGWCNHRPALWQALELTKATKLPVLELGCGFGSTPSLRQYCSDENLGLLSYDYSYEWASQFNVNHITNWETQVPWRKEFSVALVDHSPGEHRKEAIKKLLHVKILVVHDSEPFGWNSSDYQVRPLFDKFKYVKDYKPKTQGEAWTTLLSNFIQP